MFLTPCFARPEGKRALTKCQEDVQRVKASFSLVQKASSNGPGSRFYRGKAWKVHR